MEMERKLIMECTSIPDGWCLVVNDFWKATPKTWVDWASLAEIFQFVLVLIAAVYAGRQIVENIRLRELTAAIEIFFNQIGSSEVRAARSWLFSKISQGASLVEANLSEVEIETATRVAVAYDRIALLVSRQLIPEDMLLEFQGSEIRKLWPALKPLICQVRKSRGLADYCVHFERVAERMLQNKYNHLP
jgi:hypothetical protein